MRYVRISAGVLILAFVAFMTWYKVTFSMDIATEHEYKGEPGSKSILIATQGSEFKDGVVDLILKSFKGHHIKIIDISDLYKVKEDDWDCILIIHVWEVWQPPKAIKFYTERWQHPEKHVVITTSGDGHYHQENVDAITTASIIADEDKIAEKAIEKMKHILNNSDDQ